MAIIKCHECGNGVSSEAKACPNCGAKPKKRPGAIGIIFVLLVGFLMFKCTSSFQEVEQRIAAREAAKTPAKKAEEAAAEAREQKRISTALEVRKAVMSHAKNPASVRFDQLLIGENADIACGKYRATNSFNAVVPGVIVVTTKGYSFETSAWVKHCSTAKNLHDMTSYAP